MSGANQQVCVANENFLLVSDMKFAIANSIIKDLIKQLKNKPLPHAVIIFRRVSVQILMLFERIVSMSYASPSALPVFIKYGVTTSSTIIPFFCFGNFS